MLGVHRILPLMVLICLGLRQSNGQPDEGAETLQDCPSFCGCVSFSGNRRVATCIISTLQGIDLTGLHSGLTFWLRLVCLDADADTSLNSGVLNGLSNLERLDIVACKLGTLNTQVLAGLLPDSVTNLTITSTTSLVLENGWIGAIPNVRHLELSNNELEDLSVGSLCGSFLSLNLSGNYFYAIESMGITCSEDDPNCAICMPDLQVLDISENDLEELLDPLVDLMPELRELYAHSNFIYFIEGVVFQGMTKLEVIDFTWNDLEERLEPGLFQNLPSLLKLKLRVNSISGIDADTFTGSSNIKYLDLTSNGLYEFDINSGQFDFLHGLSQLEYLDLSANDFEDLPKDMFQNKAKLRILRMLYTAVTDLPTGLFESIPSLESLNIGGNEIEEIASDTFKGLTNLKTLVLADCSLTTIKAGAFEPMPNLQTLYLFQNNLITVPAPLEALDNLQILYLTDNYIPTFDSSTFSQMDSLKTVFMDGNPVVIVPNDAFGSSSTIETVDISHSSLATLQVYSFRGLTNLKKLWLNSNKISLLERAFTQLSTLEELDLSSNEIRSIETQEFPASIISLNLSVNAIDFIYAEAFNNLRNLQVVDLSINSLKTFAPVLINTGAVTPPMVLVQGNSELSCFCASLQDNTAKVCSQGFVMDYSNGQTHDFSAYIHRQDLVCNLDLLCDPVTCGCCSETNCLCSFACPSGCTCARNYDDSYQVVSCLQQGYSSIPEALPPSTSDLDLYGNQIDTIHNTSFLTYTRLLKLNLNSSGIVEIEGAAFQALTQLQELSLADNRIAVLKQNIFSTLSALTKLELQNNELVTIDEGIFGGLSSLKELYLHNNDLISIDIAIFSSNSLTAISLTGNNWNCNCQFGAYLQRFMNTNGKEKIVSTNVVCGLNAGSNTGSQLSTVNFTTCDLPDDKDEVAAANLENSKLTLILVGILIPLVLAAVGIGILLWQKGLCRKPSNKNNQTRAESGRAKFQKHMGRTWKSTGERYKDYGHRPSVRSVYEEHDLTTSSQDHVNEAYMETEP